MAYRNVEDRKAASKRHYYANKPSYLERNKKYRRTINIFVRDLKEKSPCTDCGINYPYYVIDSDHLDDKKGTISALSATGRIAALKKEKEIEIEKCEIVCANCHRIRTHERLAKAKQ